ncbi:hypothetical protein AZI98_06325 [Aeribacillus pallidus]|uniref:Uncharacterized protein n=1 Tax=Aeribacillus pallidus TaxID=33936 RepID=A0A165YK71_9BACI|nr:hypothetical protein AZI98_06325 [Aeribacillus pallidus]
MAEKVNDYGFTFLNSEKSQKFKGFLGRCKKFRFYTKCWDQEYHQNEKSIYEVLYFIMKVTKPN